MHAKPNRDTVPQVINGRINGRFAPGYSGNPGGSPEAARKALNKDTILEMHRAFKLGGRKAIDAGNAALSARRVVLTQAHIQINGRLAWEVGIEMTQRTLKNGEVLNTENFVTNVYENKNGEWLMVTHHASAVPR